MKSSAFLFIIFLLTVHSCGPKLVKKSSDLTDTLLTSPNGDITIDFSLDEIGSPTYSIWAFDQEVIKPSTLGLHTTKWQELTSGFEILSSETRMQSETWDLPWGEQDRVVNRYSELAVYLRHKQDNVALTLLFRAYDDGVAFRYLIPRQQNITQLHILDEQTTFNLTGNHTTWWIPGDWDIYEHLYTESKFSDIDALSKRNHPNLAQTYIPENAVNTPVTMKTKGGLYLSFHEANLTNYPGMTLRVNPNTNSMESALVGSERVEYKAEVNLPFTTPWRTIQIGQKAVDLVNSNLILNLNEPNTLGDVSWVKPMKYVGIWWEMHIGMSTWDKASGRHGATTENAKRYIDFAAANGFGGVLVEGWNTGWEHWIGFEDREGVFDFVTPYDDYNIKEVAAYANSKGIQLIMHNETSSATETYTAQLDTAFALMQSLDIHCLKTGYVGKILPKGEYHHGQYMVNHYRKVLETAAKYKVAVDAHEPIKDTGIRRTYPNAISREGLRGQEFNAWASDGGNPSNHLPTIAFTRMLAGPIDFTPGVFDLKLNKKKQYVPKSTNQINTTLAQQLALYVVLYSPVQMACDLPEHYVDQPAFQFIKDVAVDWQKSIALNGEPAEYVTLARKERHGDRWFVGSITNEEARVLQLPLDFLDKEKKYLATLYLDGDDAHWDHNPTSITITTQVVNSNSELILTLAPGGGAAIMLEPID